MSLAIGLPYYTDVSQLQGDKGTLQQSILQTQAQLTQMERNPWLYPDGDAKVAQLRSSLSLLNRQLSNVLAAERRIELERVRKLETERQTAITAASAEAVEKFKCPRGTTLVNKSTPFGVVAVCRSPWGGEILAGDPEAQQVPLKVEWVPPEGTAGLGNGLSVANEIANYLGLVTVIVLAYMSRPIRNFVIPLVVSQIALRHNFGVTPFAPKPGQAFTPEELEERRKSVNRVSLYVATTVWALMNLSTLAKFIGIGGVRNGNGSA